MSIMTITSTNENLSYLLNKNPATGVITRKVNKGRAFGWFTPSGSYAVYFCDGHDAQSFSEGEYDMLSKTKFTNPLSFINSMNELLRSAKNGDSSAFEEPGNVHTVKFTQVAVWGDSMLRHLKNNIPDVTIVTEEVCDGTLSIELTGGDLQQVLEISYICLLFLTPWRTLKMTKFTEEWVGRYVGIIKRYKLPYFMRYLFQRNFMVSRDLFDKFSGMLFDEADDMELKYGDTQRQRMDALSPHLSGLRPIIDVGCGEGQYLKALRRKAVMGYHAVDIDEKELAKAKRNAAKSNIKDGVEFYSNISEVEDYANSEILLTEVIEHMPLADAEALIKSLLARNFSRIVISTPNRDFNQHYHLDGGFRHDDHDWEMTTSEFNDWINRLVASECNSSINVTTFGIGDRVGKDQMCSGAMIRNTNSRPLALMIYGPSAAGKSTAAGKIMDGAIGWTELNRDNIRFNGDKERNWGKYDFTYNNEENVDRRWWKKFQTAVTCESNMVISDTLRPKGDRDRLTMELERAGYEVHTRMLLPNFDVLVERNEHRVGGVTYEFLLKQYIAFRREQLDIEAFKNTDGLEEVYICDLDGTLFDSGKRDTHNMKGVELDTPVEHVCAIVRCLIQSGKNVKFFSGRRDCFDESLASLQKYVHDGISADMLHLRDTSDRRRDAEVKIDMFTQFIQGTYNVAAVIDDRKQVIEECWSVLGVPIINVGSPTERF